MKRGRTSDNLVFNMESNVVRPVRSSVVFVFSLLRLLPAIFGKYSALYRPHPNQLKPWPREEVTDIFPDKNRRCIPQLRTQLLSRLIIIMKIPLFRLLQPSPTISSVQAKEVWGDIQSFPLSVVSVFVEELVCQLGPGFRCRAWGFGHAERAGEW